jgi:hypothetical protein|tara:strand:- start:324 stop:497 length:174 start_codon:yes stop_codon:yes gene_type:complete
MMMFLTACLATVFWLLGVFTATISTLVGLIQMVVWGFGDSNIPMDPNTSRKSGKNPE